MMASKKKDLWVQPCIDLSAVACMSISHKAVSTQPRREDTGCTYQNQVSRSCLRSDNMIMVVLAPETR